MFNVKSENGPSKITSVTATTSVSGVAATNLVFNLYDGSTKIDSKTGSSSVVFSNLNVNVDKDQTKTLTVKVEFPATSTGSQSAGVSVTKVSFDNANGSTADVNTTVNGAPQYAYAQAATFSLASVPAISVQNASFLGGTSTMNAKFSINIHPQGGIWERASASAVISWSLANSPSVIVATSSASISRINDIEGEAPTTVEFQADVDSGVPGIVAGSYVARISSMTWKVGNTTVTQTYGFEDFVTSVSPTFND